jgi:hypothetical protein
MSKRVVNNKEKRKVYFPSHSEVMKIPSDKEAEYKHEKLEAEKKKKRNLVKLVI